MQVITIGLDLAKSVFQVHGVDAEGAVVVSRKLKRAQVLKFFRDLPPCLVGMEACGSAHYWARELMALGHEVRLIPPAYVKPYVRRNKTDAVDAAAICEAVQRPGMRFVAVKSAERQAVLSMHKTRDLMVRQRTRLMNALRAHVAEHGVVAPAGVKGFLSLMERLAAGELGIPQFLARALQAMAGELASLQRAIRAVEAEILAWHRQDETSRRLAAIPGFGLITASAVAAALTDPTAFRCGRDFAASLGLTPHIDGTGGKNRLGSISKRGDRYLRKLLVGGAQSVLLSRRAKTDPWLIRLTAEKARKVAAVALANKMARIAWAMIARGETYRSETFAAA